ncbi:c-type cytochrome [Mucilaginibacter corticis]|uniref:Photosynthetic reaction center cytochrome c subunit n=2 Tax=Mucilaginibacter corticis TaxID=2597670 RepID=A0A556MHY0_9SPHI|nr:c-type cytochrome [Mucilaginibacter corticis]
MTNMHFNKKLFIPIGLFSGMIVLASMTFIQQPPQQQRVDPPITNLKVLPKKLTFKQVDHIMDNWAAALGVKCNFCHERNADGKGMNFASDAKPEKQMAREMYVMAAKLNKKYFKGEKDSLGVAKLSSVNCYTCHNGVAHLETAIWPKRGDAPHPPAPGMGAPAGQPAPQGGGR